MAAPHVDLLRLVGVVLYRPHDGVRRSFAIAYGGRWVSLDRMPRLCSQIAIRARGTGVGRGGAAR